MHDAFFHFGAQEVRELLAVGANSTLQITTSSSHFAHRHCDLLSGTKLALLNQVVQSPGVFERNIHHDIDLASMLNEVAERGYELGISMGTPNMPSTFAYLRALVSQLIVSPAVLAGFTDEVTKNKHAVLSTTMQESSMKNFVQLLKMAGEDDDAEEAKMKVHYWRLRSFEAVRVEHLTHGTAKYLASSLNWLRQKKLAGTFNTVDAKTTEVFDGVAHLDLKVISMLHADGAKEDTQRDDILNQIMADEFPNNKAKKWTKIRLGWYETDDNVCTYNSNRGNLICNELGEVEVPYQFHNYSFFNSLFGDIQKLRKVKEVEHKYRHINKERTIAGDSIDVEYELTLYDGNPTIHRYIDAHAQVCAQAINPRELGPIEQLSDVINTSHTIAWIYADGNRGKNVTLSSSNPSELMLTDIQGSPMLSLARESGRWHASLPGSPTKRLATINSVSRMFHRIEDKSSMFVFASKTDGGGKGLKLASVWLPRYSLNFTNSADDGCLTEPKKGFKICQNDLQYLGVWRPETTPEQQRDTNEPLVNAETGFGDFEAYLIVRDAREGKRNDYLVIMPAIGPSSWTPQTNVGLGSPTSESIKLEPPGFFEGDNVTTKVPYYTYRLVKNEGSTSSSLKVILEPVVPGSHERVMALAHVATVLLSERQYAACAAYLEMIDRTIKQSRHTSPEEMKAMKNIATFVLKNGDNTPAALAVRLKAESIIRRKLDNGMENPFGPSLPRNSWGNWVITIKKEPAEDSSDDQEMSEALQEIMGKDFEGLHLDIGIDVTVLNLNVSRKVNEAMIDTRLCKKLPDCENGKTWPGGTVTKIQTEAPFIDLDAQTLDTLETYFINLNRISMNLRTCWQITRVCACVRVCMCVCVRIVWGEC